MLHDYDGLAIAVVKRAANDYRKALCMQKKYADEIKELERFFAGQDIKQYTKTDGEQLMEDIRNEVIKYKYNYRTLQRIYHGLDE